jgi:hypothetical protein
MQQKKMDYKMQYLLRCDTMQSGRNIPTFQRYRLCLLGLLFSPKDGDKYLSDL